MQYFTHKLAIESLHKEVYYYTMWQPFQAHFIGHGVIQTLTSTGVKMKKTWGSNLNHASWELHPDGVYLVHGREKYPVFWGLPEFNVYKVYDESHEYFMIASADWEIESLLEAYEKDYTYRIVYNAARKILKPLI